MTLVLADQAATQTLTSIATTPANPTINVGQTQHFTATGTFSDSSTEVLSTNVWHFEDPLPTARCQTTAVELNGKVYAIGGRTDCHEGMGTPLNTVDVFDSVLDTWTAGTPMPTARNELTAAAVNGKIYVIGGIDGQDEKKVEIFDPATNIWSTGANMPTGRIAMGAAVVNSKIYVAGGCIKQATPDDATCPLATLEIYDPSNNTWTPGASMSTVRDTLGVAALNGKIYAVGGSSGPALLASGEVYDPTINTWSPIAPMPTPRSQLRLAALNGLLYAIGGEVQTGPNTGAASTVVEVYDPTTNTWSTAPSLLAARGGHGVVVVNGRIGVGGGFGTNNAALSSVEVFTPPMPATAGTWVTKTAMATARYAPAGGVINGVLYVVGGANSNSSALSTFEAYDPVTNTWTSKASMSTARTQGAVGVINGILYVVGGTTSGGSFLSSVEAYDPVTNTWTAKASMPTARTNLAVGVVNGTLYAVGGQTIPGGGYLSTVEAYDPVTNTWTTKASMPTARAGLGIGVVNGILYAVGGTPDGVSFLTTVVAYDPVTNTWTTKASMPTVRNFPAVGVVNGVLYAAGGNSSGGAILATVEAYDPVTNTWTAKPSMPTARTVSAAGEINGVLYIAGGSTSTGTAGALATVEAFTPPGEVTWSSSNGGVATIDVNGVATALSPGSSTITATHTSGSISGSTLLSVAPPTIASVFPPSAQAGSVVTITGTGFGSTQGGNTVTIGGVTATVISWSDTEIVAIVPGGAEGTNQAVTVNVGGTPSNAPTLSSVTAGIASLAFSPLTPTIAVGQTQPFTITATMTDGSMQTITIPVPYGIKILGGAQRAVAIDPATGSVTPTGPVLSTFIGASAGPSALDVQGGRGFVIIGGRLITVNTATETVQFDVALGGGVSSLEYDSVQNKLLGVALLDHDNDEQIAPVPTPRRNVLVEVTPSTGALTMIGTGATGFPEVSAGVSAIDPAGQRYFVTLANSLVIFNTQTGAVTSIALAETPSSMEYDSGENRLFGIVLSSAGVNRLVEIIPGTGQVNFLSASGLPGPMNVSAGVATLDPGNNRYYVSFAGQFHTIDTTTGNVLSSAPFSGASSLLFYPLLTSSDPTVATVSQNPSATGVSPGPSTITATVADADASTLLTVVSTANLSITKTDAPDPVGVVSLLTYTVTVTNNGPQDATNVTVTDTLPAVVTYDDVSSDPSCSGPASGPVTCALGTLANGSPPVSIMIKAFTHIVPALLNNTVTVSATEADPFGADNLAFAQTVSRSASPQADLALTVTDSPDPITVSPAQPVTYTLTVRNNGGDVATGVTLTTNVPAGANLAMPTPNCTVSAIVTCNLGTIDINSTASQMLTLTPSAAGFLTLTASAATDGTTTDPNPTNNTNIAEQTTVALQSFTVNSTGDGPDASVTDGVCATASGQCTLRAAIEQANHTPALDLIRFSIGSGLQVISPTSALPTIAQPVFIDATTQPGFAGTPRVELSGANAGTSADALLITAGNSTVRGLIINRFSSNGIRLLTNGGNVIEGNIIGTDASNTALIGNVFRAIDISNVPNNRIGGTTPAARNIISGNQQEGVLISGAGATGNFIQGNYIGTNAAGSGPLPNRFGVLIGNGATGNTVGGTSAGARNVISANSENGVMLQSGNNSVLGNFIGTNAAGTAAVGNGLRGIEISDAPGNTIGGTAGGAGNVISGNDQEGILIRGASSTATLVQGNYIGTKVNGVEALANGADGVVLTSGVANNTIGGTAAGAGNVISGNTGNGVDIIGTTTTGNSIEGNIIGLNSAGTVAVPNVLTGVRLTSGASNNTIGGTTAGARNVISGNAAGVMIISSSNNLVQGNYIGTNAAGTGAFFGNNGDGVLISNGASTNTIGGTTAGAGNLIAFNTQDGVVVTGAASKGNAVLVNSIHSNGELGIDLGNDGITPNDPGDVDASPNDLQNFPVLTSATAGASTTITGTLNSTATTQFRIEFFSNLTCDPSGFGEGQVFLGFANVTTDGAGNAPINTTIPTSVPVGQVITATATDPANNTSEFSACVTVTSAVVINLPPVLTTANPTVNEGTLLTVTLTGQDPETQPVTITSVTNLPAGATYTAGTAQLTWTPAPNQSGTYPLEVTLNDGAVTAMHILTLTVNNTIPDQDGDGIPDTAGFPPYPADNCPTVFNPNQADFDGDGIGDLCDPNPTGTPFVEDPQGNPDPKVTNDATVVPPANGTAYQPEEPIFITANVTFRRVDRDGDGIPDPYFAVRPDPFNVFLDVVQCPAGTIDCHNPAGTRVHVNRIPEAPALHIPNSLMEIPGGTDPCPPDTVQIDAPGTPEHLACQAATVINVTETRTAFTGGGVLAITPTYFNYIQDPEYNPVATPETPKCTTPEEGCYSPVWMGTAEAPPTMVQVTPPPLPGTPPPPLLAPHVAVVPTTWDLTWEFTPSSGGVDVYVGNLSNGFTVNQVQADQVRLNGTVAPSFTEILSSFSGFTGLVLHLSYNQTEAMRSLRALASRNFVPEGDQEPALLTGVLTADGHPGEQVALFRATPLVQLKDLTAPTLTTPTAITVNATSAAGAVVTYTATATDVFDATPTVNCTPPSGSTFPVGTTTVTCTATDDAGNTATKTFPVTVTNAVTQINVLIAKVQGLTGVSTKLKTGLIRKLTNAKKELAHGKVAVACLRLTDFITKVNRESGKGLTVVQANDLRADATRIKAVLGCP